MKLEDVYEDRQNLFLVMEICSGGELYDRIVSHQHYGETQAVDVIKQMLEACAYFHSHRVIHNDLVSPLLAFFLFSHIQILVGKTFSSASHHKKNILVIHTALAKPDVFPSDKVFSLPRQ